MLSSPCHCGRREGGKSKTKGTLDEPIAADVVSAKQTEGKRRKQ